VSNSLQILVLSTFNGTNANVISDYLFSFNAFSRHRCYYVFDCLKLDQDFPFDRFDVILIFWSVYLPGANLSPQVMQAIAEAKAHKVLFLQDEYRDVRPINQLMAQLGINHMFTCVEPSQYDYFYPKSTIPSLQSVHSVLTGYVPSYLERHYLRRKTPHPIDIGYRSRKLPMYLGDLGQHKRIIGEKFLALGNKHGLNTDISTCEEDRLYGNDWVKFVRSCKVSIGIPSGASLIDLHGDIRKKCEVHLQDHPTATYEEVKKLFFKGKDGDMAIETISPRVFEATALGSTLCLLEGNYAGIVEPDVHYIRIARDYSNLDEVAEKIQDNKLCTQLAQRAYADLIDSGKYSYRAFVQRFDAILDDVIEAPVRNGSVSKTLFCVSRYSKYDKQRIVPFRQKYILLPSVTTIWRAGRPVMRLMKILGLDKLARPSGLYRLLNRAVTNPPQSPLTKLRMGYGLCKRCPHVHKHIKFAFAGSDKTVKSIYSIRVSKSTKHRWLLWPSRNLL